LESSKLNFPKPETTPAIFLNSLQ